MPEVGSPTMRSYTHVARTSRDVPELGGQSGGARQGTGAAGHQGQRQAEGDEAGHKQAGALVDADDREQGDTQGFKTGRSEEPKQAK